MSEFPFYLLIFPSFPQSLGGLLQPNGALAALEGFDEGVATMRQGERALLKLAPDVAYGAMGARDEKLR